MRVAVIGTSGSGKSTFARRLARLLGTPLIELDAINWQAGWRDLNTDDPDEFQRRVALALAHEAWVSDGNYRLVRDQLLARATHLIWLDHSRILTMRRVLWRSLKRAVTQEEIWPGTGNRETLRMWLGKDHPIRWAWDTYRARRQEYAMLMQNPAFAHIAKHRIRRPREIEPLTRRLLAEAETESRVRCMPRGPR